MLPAFAKQKSLLGYAARFTVLLVGMPVLLQAQTRAEEKDREQEAVRQQVEARRYDIRATQASSQRGRTVNLTSDYGITVRPDTVRCDLPFFGRSFAGSPYGGEGGINLLSTDFEYESKPWRKGGWQVTIRPRADRDVRIINLYIGPDGYCTANFTLNSRSPMSFFGTVVTR